MNKLEDVLYALSHPEEVCHIVYEDREGIKYGQCQTASKVRGFDAITRYNEFRRLKCPDMDFICPYMSGKFVPENHTHILDSQ
jgi:hypothetical protein